MNKWYLFICSIYFYSGFGVWSLRAAQQQAHARFNLDAALVGLSSQRDSYEWGLYLYKPAANSAYQSALGRVRFSVNRDKDGDLVGTIEQLEVAKNYRKKGYGSALFVMGCDFLRSLQVAHIDVHLLPEIGYEKKLEEFYKRLGCVVDRAGIQMHLDLNRCKPLPFPGKELAGMLRRYKKYEQRLQVNLGLFDSRSMDSEQLFLHMYIMQYVNQYLAARSHDNVQKSGPDNLAQRCRLNPSVVGFLMVGCSAVIVVCYQLFKPLLLR